MKNFKNLNPDNTEVVAFIGCSLNLSNQTRSMKPLRLPLALKNIFLNSSLFISGSRTKGLS